MPESCPDSIPNFNYLGEFEDHKYFLSEDKDTWMNARDFAIVSGGYLTSITSLNESNFLVDKIAPYQEMAYIGFNDSEMEGNLVWDNGEAVSFYNLTTTNGASQDFATISPWTGEWMLDSEFTVRRYIVEIPCNEVAENGSLVITNVECPQEFPFANSQLSFNVTIRNTDTIPSLESDFGIYQEITNVTSNVTDDLLGSGIVPPLAPGDFTTITIVATINEPFYFPGYSDGEDHWHNFYAQRFFNPTGLSLEPNASAYDVAIYCQTYDADVEVDLTTNSTSYGDSAYFQYFVEITNNGPETAYNLKAEVAKTELGNIPSLDSDFPHLTYEIDGALTKIVCVDSLEVGTTIKINVFNDFDNDINSSDTIPDSYTVSVNAYSEHLIDPQPWNNSRQQIFTFDPNFSDDCPLSIPGFQILGQYNQHRYFISYGKHTWEEAKIIAEENNGYLACFETQAESDFAMDVIKENAFIGISDREVEGELAWVNGEELLYDNVQNTNGPNLDYGSLNFWNGLWVLNKLTSEMKFILEVPCSFQPGTFPNLTGSEFEVDVADTLNNGTFEFIQDTTYNYSFILNNDGTQDAANDYFVEVFLSTDDSLSNNDFSVGSFLTGFTGIMQEDFVTIPSGIFIPWDFLLGEYYLLLHIDPDNEIEELNEDDNVIVYDKKITVTGLACSMLPVVEDNNLTVLGIPQGNSVFALYNNSWEIINYYTCSGDCDQPLLFADLPDGIYYSFVYHYNDDWVYECHMRVNFEIVLGEGIILSLTEAPSEDQKVLDEVNELLKKSPTINQTLFPNPASNQINAHLVSSLDANAQIEIYDIHGKLVLSQTTSIYEGIQTIEIDITSLATGIHHLTIRNNDEIFSTSRFIKH